MAPACGSRCATAGPAGTTTGGSVRHAAGALPSLPMRRCWRSAAQAGRGSARTAAGSTVLADKGVRSRRCGPPIAASSSPGRTSSARASTASRSSGSRCPSARTGARRGDHHARPARGRRRSTRCRRRCARPSRRMARRCCTSTCAPMLIAAELERACPAPRGKQSFSTFLRKAAAALARRDRLAARSHDRVRRQSLSAMPPAAARGAHQGACRSGSPARRRSRARSRPPAALRSTNSTPTSCSASCPACSSAGEMLDWEAPTGGYLLQASFATGAAAGRGALGWLAR